ncbi:site-specific integrase [Streptomyces lavendulocolor]|uniref:Site-specific integrase n=1 Tax=Streptomyces lavendulocolor TaxID=67316 RepID=A0ABV2W4N4_9ACTN
MEQAFYLSEGWESWGLEFKPVIPEGMVLVFDDDLRFEDEHGLRTSAIVNRWACELPTNGCPAANSWTSYVGAVRQWSEFGEEHGVGLFDSRERLKALLSAYAVYRSQGPISGRQRFRVTTWNQHMTMLSIFYAWAIENGYATSLPFTYRQATAVFSGQRREVRRNSARRRQPKPHVTIKYLEDEFADLFHKGLARLQPDGSVERGYRGREMARNAAVGRFVFSSGPRKQEFSYLLACEVPTLPSRRSEVPVLVPLSEGITKGSKFRNAWIDYDALAELHNYLEFERAAAVQGSTWMPPRRWGEPLIVTEATALGGRINGTWTTWETLGPPERRRLVAPGGGSMLLSVCGPGRPFTGWNTVFERASDRIRERYEPRFPHVTPHRGRHTFAMQTMAKLVHGYYERAARLVKDGDDDAGLALYLKTTEPLLVLRDLLGHSSVLTTEIYLNRLDTTRIFAELHRRVGEATGLLPASAVREAEAEFDDEDDDSEDL